MHTVYLSTLLIYTQQLITIFTCACLGKVGNGSMSVDDSAFDGILRQVECMYAQGKASFEAVFNVS